MKYYDLYYFQYYYHYKVCQKLNPVSQGIEMGARIYQVSQNMGVAKPFWLRLFCLGLGRIGL